jgi:hypothetical protein
MRHVPDAERRARLAVRHALAPSARVSTPEAATAAVAVLHATEPATVYLSCWARVDGLALADVDRALYDDRNLVKQLAMRRTLFVFPRELLPAVWPSASARVARTERNAIAKDALKAGLDGGDGWLDVARAQVLSVLSREPDGLQAAAIREAAPALDVKVSVSAGSQWSGSRVLTHLGLTGELMRGENTGHWRTSRPRWTLTGDWLPEVPAWWTPEDGYRELVRRWLAAFGPGTEADIVWWLGATKGIVRAALSSLEAVEVGLDSGETGWLLPDDLDPVADPGPWVALLPALDPTTMGWRGRDFYLGPHREALFDRNGNGGTTAWVDGRIVGCWVQDEAGVVSVVTLEPVSAAARRALEAEAERLTAWLAGLRLLSAWSSPAMRAATA